MSGGAAAAAVLAAAVLVAPGRSAARDRVRGLLVSAATGPARRLTRLPAGRVLPALAGMACGVLAATVASWPVGVTVGGVATVAAQLALRFSRHRRRGGASASAALRLRHAAGWDLLAACLRAGMPVPAAIRAIAVDLDGPAATALSHTAELMALGADPVAAWDPALGCQQTAELARSARRAARSGTALAAVAARLARDARASADDGAETGAQRAAVLITMPLGLCFLPAFVCLGVVPVVIGLAGDLLSNW